ncbi:MAG: hypothetical protein GVY06_10960 [Alphaproteobacteria bacterium]|jgi:hypothetical protein|nr:hypothetical protein [Alphaproteobacteria bacterium]
MQLFMILILFALVWLTFGMLALGQRARRLAEGGENEADLRARIRALEAIVTDQDRQLRRDFDGMN